MAIAAIRYNNPGNVSLPIRGWNGGGFVVGISGQPGYASFPDMTTGAAALQQRLSTRIDDGYNTISSLNGVYAEDSNWKYGVSKASGIGVNDVLDPNNASQMSALTGGIIKQETGMSSDQLGISGLSVGGNTAANYDPSYGLSTGDYSWTSDGTSRSTDDGLSVGGVDQNGYQQNGSYQLTAAGDYDWTGAQGTSPLDVAGAQDRAAAAAASNVSSGNKGDASSTPEAIVTAGNQQAITLASGLKAIASGAAAASQSANATATANQGTFLGWLGNRLLQVMVFVVAAIFLLIGLYMFSQKGTIVMQKAAS